MFLRNWLLAGAVALVVAGSSQAQNAAAVAGIPINDQLTITKCGGCHQRDGGCSQYLEMMHESPSGFLLVKS